MSNVEVIKAVKNDKFIRGKRIDILKVAAYCRVSTDGEDQLNSYNSQVAYYSDMIKQNPEWELVDVYADEGITGTLVNKRDDFQRMIADCLAEKINIIITKSISRFARNTIDTLKYVRMLKEKNIAVMFEEEKINTLTMDGELLLTILSSVAQQEVENISANVKKGIKMKVSRGEFLGFSGCLGYDWIPETKSIVVNKEEAEIVKYIFERYIQGIGANTIGKELEAKGYKTKRGSLKWGDTTVMGIIKNEKYTGDVLFGKTFTADPISKRRLVNMGEEDKYYIRDNHEPIIDKETFELAQKIREKRNVNRGAGKGDGSYVRQHKYTRKHSLSSMLRCGFCGDILTRRSWHSGSEYQKYVWQCVTSTKKGKRYCSCSRGIEEVAIEKAFVKSYKLLYENDAELMIEFLNNARTVLSGDDTAEGMKKAKENLAKHKMKKDNLLNMKLNGLLDDDTFAEKNFMLAQKISSIEKTIEHLERKKSQRNDVEKRIKEFRKVIEKGEIIDEFDRDVFESVIDHVIIGGYDEYGHEKPDMITFVYRAGEKAILSAKEFKQQRKNAAGYINLEGAPFNGYMEILKFEDFNPHMIFVDRERTGRHKILKYTYEVSVGIAA